MTASRIVEPLGTMSAGRRIEIRGVVQGVGLPAVGLPPRAELGGLTGAVRNDARGVTIEAFGGERRELDAFLAAPPPSCPPAARIDALVVDGHRRRARAGDVRDRAERRATAPCAVDPARPRDLRRVRARDRRPARPALPLRVHELHALRPALHDRARRPLRPRGDDDGAVRDVPGLPPRVRGPGRSPLPRAAERLPRVRAARSRLVDAAAATGARATATRSRGAAALLARGAIVAVKGLGGFHLACDATDADGGGASSARRKHRDEKPFAVMVRDLAAARAPRRCSATRSARCSQRPSGPIVLAARAATRRARRRTRSRPDSDRIGLMLPVHAAAPPAARATSAGRS